MLEILKKFLYFPIASYFRFFAEIRLRRWNPRVIVVTGSNGKTTLLHLLEAQIGEKAKYSHHANSSYGVPFDILGLHRKTLQRTEWVGLFIKAPFAVFKKLPKEKLYLVETDCDRPNEGKFLASLLRPEIVLWLNVSRTHSMNFDHLVSQKLFSTVDEAIAYEYGYFLEYCSQLALINGDLPLEAAQTTRTKATVVPLKQDAVKQYELTKSGTTFGIDGKKIIFPSLLPQEVGMSLLMCKKTIDYLALSFDPTFSSFTIPSGRGSVFAGIKNTTFIDSSYNANLGSIKAMLAMFAKIPEKKKWVVLGDMLELGKEEKEEHEKLAEMLAKFPFQRIILIGSRMEKYTYPQLQKLVEKTTHINCYPKEKGSAVIDELQRELQGGELVLFKGSQSLFLEGIIERLLENKEDSDKLPRREQSWEAKRARLMEN